MGQTPKGFQQQKQFYLDVHDVFATDAGRRVLAWWRRQVTSVVDTGNPNVSHFLLARRVDFDRIEHILASDVGELVAALEAQQAQMESLAAGDGSTDGSAGDDWLYQRKGHKHGEG